MSQFAKTLTQGLALLAIAAASASAMAQQSGASRSAGLLGQPAHSAPRYPNRPVSFEEETAGPPVLTEKGTSAPSSGSTAPRLPREPSARPASSVALAPKESASHGAGKLAGPMKSLATVGSALAVVLGLFFLIAWIVRKGAPRGSGSLPREAFEVLGRAPLALRQVIHLVRIGDRLLVVWASSSDVRTLAEISDPHEARRLVELCQRTSSGAAGASFGQVFEQYARGESRRGEAVRG